MGVAEFETEIEECEAAGEAGYENDAVRKSDMFATLPDRLQGGFVWNSTTPRVSYAEFR